METLRCSAHIFPLELDSEDRGPFRDLWEKVDRTQNEAPYLDVSTARFSMATRMAGDPAKPFYRFVDYITSMEALLTKNEPELSFKLPTRMGVLLGRSPQENQDVFDFMRAAYRVRSKLVHGEPVGKLLPLTIRGVQIGFEEAIGRLHSYCRDCIRYTVDLVDAGLKKKEELTDLLDYALVNTDLRISLMSFLHVTKAREEFLKDFQSACKASFQKTLHDERHGVLH